MALVARNRLPLELREVRDLVRVIMNDVGFTPTFAEPAPRNELQITNLSSVIFNDQDVNEAINDAWMSHAMARQRQVFQIDKTELTGSGLSLTAGQWNLSLASRVTHITNLFYNTTGSGKHEGPSLERTSLLEISRLNHTNTEQGTPRLWAAARWRSVSSAASTYRWVLGWYPSIPATGNHYFAVDAHLDPKRLSDDSKDAPYVSYLESLQIAREAAAFLAGMAGYSDDAIAEIGRYEADRMKTIDRRTSKWR